MPAQDPSRSAAQDEPDWAHLAERSLKATRRVLRGPDAEDAAQEALLRAWRHRSSLREGERQGAWMAVIAHNAALHHYKRERAIAETRGGDESSVERAIFHEAGFDETLDRLDFDRLLSPLSERDRQLLWLRFAVDLSFEEVAFRMDMSVSTTKVRLHRLRPRLQTILKERRSQP